MRKIILGCSILLISTAFSIKVDNDPAAKYYKVYSKQGKEVTLDSIVNAFKGYDIVLFGEEHNDSIAHYLQMRFLEKSYEKYGQSVVLSMEMFERESQPILDEYLNGYIKESHFKKDAKVWSNYKDYRPMVEFSKTKGIKVVAANGAMRYASISNRKGVQELEKLSPEAKRWIAPLPFDTATGKYYEKLREIMGYNMAQGGHEEKGKAATAPAMQNMMPKSLSGQSLWDATMAYSISTVYKKTRDAKVVHLNGRFHSDEYFGVYQQLQKYAKGKKVLVISTVSDQALDSIDFKQYNALADYVIFTDPSIPKTFK